MGANLKRACLCETDFEGAVFNHTVFGMLNLTEATNVELARHFGPSTIGVDTMVLSKGRIPTSFLRGCGLKPWEILQTTLYDPDLTTVQINDIQYRIFEARTSGPLILGGAFISYSHEEAAFVDKLRSKLTEKGVSVWLDRHDAVAGPLQKQIDRAIGANNVVLLVLSERSIQSDWVEHEMKAARRIEKAEGRDVLCPVALDDAWKKRRYEVEREHITKKNIIDFSKWKTKSFNAQFDKLLKGLKIFYTRDA